jgi:hypothetical protein
MSPAHAKRIFLIIAIIAAATVTWWASHAWLSSPDRFTGYSILFWPSLAVSLLGAVAGLGWMLLERPVDRLAAILGSWATFIVFWSPDIWYLSVLPLFLLLWWESGRRMRDDLSDRRTLRINATLGRGVKLTLLGAFLMISLGFYLLPSTRTIGVSHISTGVREQVDQAYDNPLVQSQLATEEFPPAFQQQVRADLLARVDAVLRQWLGPLGPFLPPILAFVLFLAMWSVSFIFREVAIWLGMGLFALLRMSGFVRIGERDVTMKVLEL